MSLQKKLTYNIDEIILLQYLNTFPKKFSEFKKIIFDTKKFTYYIVYKLYIV